MRIHVALDGIGNIVGRALPDVDHAFILFLISEQATAEVALNQLYFFQGLVDDLLLFGRNGDIGHCDAKTRAGGISKTDILDAVGHLRGLIFSADLIQLGDQVLQLTLIQFPVDELDLRRQNRLKITRPTVVLSRRSSGLGRRLP